MLRSIFNTRINQFTKIVKYKKAALMALNMRTSSMDVQLDNKYQNLIRVHCVENEHTLHATFTYRLHSDPDKGVQETNDKKAKERSFNSNRLVTEPVGEMFKRLKVNIVKHFVCKSKKSKKSKYSLDEIHAIAEQRVKIKLFDQNGLQVDESKPNSSAWAQGGTLQINDCAYLVEINSPTVELLSLPSIMLSGFIMRPTLLVKFAMVNQCEFSWSRPIDDTGNYTVIGTNEWYTPVLEDIGLKLKLTVVPKNGDRQGQPMDAISKYPVKEGPKMQPILDRQMYTAYETTHQSFRIVSYNVLAAMYTESDFSLNNLFPHCLISQIDYDYRKPLIAKELLGYRPDIICLQELDMKHFEQYYQPLFSSFGYQSSILLKQHQRLPKSVASESQTSELMEMDEIKSAETGETGETDTETDSRLLTVREGSAIMFKTSKFREIGRHNLCIADSIDTDPLFEDIMEKALTSDMVAEKLLYRSGSSLQVVVLESVDDPRNRLCVSTTHLFFHPLADVVRLLQTAVEVRFLESIKPLYESKNHKLSVIFCGDFNSNPKSQLVQFILNRFINKSDRVFTENDFYKMSGLELKHDMDLGSACGFPKYTNYVPTFKQCIDYIFYEKDNLFVESVVPIPSEDALTAQGGGIPNENFPSDHIALICELGWK